jgi:hypothetical protein
MNFKIAVVAVIVGMWIVGLFLAQGQGPNYENDPVQPQRPIDKILETSKPDPFHGYIDDPFSDPGSDYEFEDGQNTP